MRCVMLIAGFLVISGLSEAGAYEFKETTSSDEDPGGYIFGFGSVSDARYGKVALRIVCFGGISGGTSIFIHTSAPFPGKKEVVGIVAIDGVPRYSAGFGTDWFRDTGDPLTFHMLESPAARSSFADDLRTATTGLEIKIENVTFAFSSKGVPDLVKKLEDRCERKFVRLLK